MVRNIPASDLIKFETLGQGSFGIAYRCEWRMTTVATKELLLHRYSDNAHVDFLEQAEMMQLLHHPNIVGFYGISLTPSKHCAIMEYLEGGSLFNLINSAKALPWEIRLSICRDITSGLWFLHDHNIIHSDLKSSNVLLTSNYQAKLCDFGFSKVKAETRAVLTDCVQSSGTVRWMAPELFSMSAKFSTQADMYSLGMTFWELTSRKLPFQSQHMLKIPAMIIKGKREEIPMDCPQFLSSLIMSCWEAKPENRPEARTVLTILQDADSHLFPGDSTASIPITEFILGNKLINPPENNPVHKLETPFDMDIVIVDDNDHNSNDNDYSVIDRGFPNDKETLDKTDIKDLPESTMIKREEIELCERFLKVVEVDDIEGLRRLLNECSISKQNTSNGKAKALMQAIIKGNMEIVTELLRSGLDLHTQDENGWTAMMHACFSGKTDILSFLVSAGTNLNHQDLNKDTALIVASREGVKEVVYLLLSYGADATICNQANQTASMVAKTSEIRFLIETLAEEFDEVGYNII